MAAASVHDILLRVLGDEEDAREALSDLATQLAVFSKASAEAEADVLTEPAVAKLRELRAQLERIDKSEADVAVQAQIAQALIELQAIEHELAELDGREAEIDVDVRRGVLERLNQATNSVLRLTSRVDLAEDATESWIDAFKNLSLRLGPFTTSIARGGAIVFAVLLPALVAVVGAAAALASSLVFAVGGLGALAVAAGSLLAPAIGLVVAGVQRFKDQADIAGTASNALKKAFNGIGDAAKQLLPAADPVLRALADGIEKVSGGVKLIAPLFRQFGQAAGDALKILTDTLTSPEIISGFAEILSVGSLALEPLAEIAGSLARIFTNIAQATMPLLIEALEGVSGLFEGWAEGSDDANALGEGIQTLVGHLSSWVQLGGELGRGFLGFLKAAAPAGKQLVDSLSEGASNLADWIESAEGQEAIKHFFDDVLPLAEELMELVVQLAAFFIQLGQIAAPAMEAWLTVLNDVLGVINAVLGAFIDLAHNIEVPDLGAVFGDIGGVISSAFGTAVGFIRGVFSTINGIVLGFRGIIQSVFSAIPGIVSGAFAAVSGIMAGIRGLIQGAFSGIGNIISGAFQAGVGVASGILRRLIGVARSVMGVIRGVFRVPIQIAVGISRAVLGAARGIFGAVRGIFRGAIQIVVSISRAIVGIARGIWGQIRGIMRQGIDIVVRMADGIVSAARDVWNTIKGIFSETISVNIDFPSPPGWLDKVLMTGARDFEGGLAMVGEAGPELAYIPEGADVYTANQTKRILRALAAGSRSMTSKLQSTGEAAVTPLMIAPTMVPAGAAGGGNTIYNFDVIAPPGEAPDVDAFLAQTSAKVRSLGGS